MTITTTAPLLVDGTMSIGEYTVTRLPDKDGAVVLSVEDVTVRVPYEPDSKPKNPVGFQH